MGVDRGIGKTTPRTSLAWLAIIGLVVILDQLSKFWVLEILSLPARPGGSIPLLPFFRLTYLENAGVSFGLFKAGSTVQAYLLVALTSFVACFFLLWLFRGPRFWQKWGLSLAIGGAIGNIIDRLRFHYVVDFLDAGPIFPWVFNVADSAITIGAGLLLLDLIRQSGAESDTRFDSSKAE